MRRPVAVALGSSALLLACAAPLLWTTLTGPSAEAVPPGHPPTTPTVPRRPLPARRHRGGHRRRRRAAGHAAAGGLPAPHRGDRRDRPRHALHSRPRNVAYANFAFAGRRSAARRRTRCGRSAPSPPQAPRRCSSPATPPASSTRSRACSITRRWSWRSSPRPPAPPLHADRLDPAADQDAADERADAGRDAGPPRPRLPGRAGSTPPSTTPARPRSR